MHENCYVLEAEDLFRKLDDSLTINKNVIISRRFFTRQAWRNEKLSKDEEKKLILDNWQQLLE